MLFRSRRNHSYAVRYYAPAGTDATIFPPWTGMRFTNDTRGALLIQTAMEGDNAYFIYYGTKPTKRHVELVGPFTWDIKEPPEDKHGYTTLIPEGETRTVGSAVPGMKTKWYRLISLANGKTEAEEFLSEYAARPNYAETGVAAGDPRAPEEDAWRKFLADLSGKER